MKSLTKKQCSQNIISLICLIYDQMVKSHHLKFNKLKILGNSDMLSENFIVWNAEHNTFDINYLGFESKTIYP